MFRIIWIALLSLLVVPLLPPGGSVERTVAGSGAWISLFDGSSTSEWRGFRQKRFPSETWVVRDGSLVRSASETESDLATKRSFGDFELEFEWNISPGGNSGIKYLVREDRPTSWEKAAYEYTRNGMIERGLTGSEEFRKHSLSKYRHAPIGFEFQILDDERNGDARNGAHRATGALYDLLPRTRPVSAPAGVFNRGRLIVDDGHIQHWVNGLKVLDFDQEGTELRDRIARSKFSAMAGFGLNRRGRITLQDHGDEVKFRSIRIREFDSPG